MNASKIVINKEQKINLLIITSIIAFIFILKCLQHYTFNTHAYDLSTFDTAISNTLKLKFLYSNQIERSILSEHFCPIILIYLPLYLIFNSIYWLFLSQAILVGIIFCICFKIARFYDFDIREARFIGLICIFNRRLAQGIMYNYHPEIFAIPLLLLIIYCYLKNKNKYVYLFSTLLLIVKEDMALSLIGFYIFLNKKFSLKLKTSLISFLILYFIFIIFFLIPYFGNFNNDQSWMIKARWGQFGNSKLEIFMYFITHPIFIIKSLLNSYYKLLETFYFLPVLSPNQLLMSLPYISLHTTSSFNIQSELKLYYSFGILPFIYWGAITSLAEVKSFIYKILKTKYLFINKYLISIIFVILLTTQWGWKIYLPNKDCFKQHDILQTIPKNVKISSQGPIVPHLRNYKFVKVFPYQNNFSYENADYIIINKQLDSFPVSKKELNNINETIFNSKSWKNIYDDGNIYVYKKYKFQNK